MRDDSPNPIRVARERAGLTQLQLAARAELTIGTVSLAERGIVTDRTLEAVAKVLGASVAALRTNQRENTMPNESSFITLQKSGAHLDAINKALGVPPPSLARATQAVADLEKVQADTGIAQNIAATKGHGARIAKAVAAQGARGAIDAAKVKAQQLVDAAKAAAQDIAQRLRDAPSTFSTQQAREAFRALCTDARSACLEVGALALAAAATTADSAEAQAFLATAGAWSDTAASLREFTGTGG